MNPAPSSHVQRLSMDCSFAGLTLALRCADGRLFSRSNSIPRASDDLHVQLQDLLTEAGLTTGDLTDVAVTTGPGSFTGIRLGLVVAQAIKLVHPHVHITGLPTLALLARQYYLMRAENGPFRVILNAAGGQVYVQAFHPNATPADASSVQSMHDLSNDQPLYVQTGLALPVAPPSGSDWFGALMPETLDTAAADATLLVPAQPVYLKPLGYRITA